MLVCKFVSRDITGKRLQHCHKTVMGHGSEIMPLNGSTLQCSIGHVMLCLVILVVVINSCTYCTIYENCTFGMLNMHGITVQ